METIKRESDWPKFARYIAEDSRGDSWFFRYKPDPFLSSWSTFRCQRLDGRYLVNRLHYKKGRANKNWRNSLRVVID